MIDEASGRLLARCRAYDLAQLLWRPVAGHGAGGLEVRREVVGQSELALVAQTRSDCPIGRRTVSSGRPSA